MQDLDPLTRRRFLAGLIASVAAAGVLDKVPGMAGLRVVGRDAGTYGWTEIAGVITIDRDFVLMSIQRRIVWSPAPLPLAADPDDGELLPDQASPEVAPVLELDGRQDPATPVEALGPQHEPA